MGSTRDMSFLLAAPERRLLRAIAARLPRGIRPNHLSVLGVVGAVGTAGGYALSTLHPGWLWLASGMLVVNWFGDSLDGTLARVRQIERPKYGYYLDHMVDAFNTAVIGVGIGLSPLVTLEIAWALVVIYLALSINVYLESAVFDVFDMGYGIFGPTEVRILLILGNVLLYGGPQWFGVGIETFRRMTDGVVGAIGVLMFITLAIRFGKNLSRLAKMEPQNK